MAVNRSILILEPLPMAHMKTYVPNFPKFFIVHKITWMHGLQRQKNPVGASALPTGKFLRVRKVFARPESFCAYLHKIKSKKVWKVSGQSGKFPDSLESFRTVWKVSGQSGKFQDSLESFWTVWKVSGQSGKFLDSLESFWTVWKVS